MPGLLTCVTERGTGYGCCVEDAYPLQEIDCVRQCLLALKKAAMQTHLPQYVGAVRFGVATQYELGRKMQDLQMLVDLLVDIFDERRATIASTGTDPGVAAIWEDHGLVCVAEYFRCHHGMNLRQWFLKAGLYDPANVPAADVLAALPVPYDVLCGAPAPITPVDPGEWPPVPVDCGLDPEYEVEGSIDLGAYFIGFQSGPAAIGTFLYLVQSIDVNGYGSVPGGTPGAVNDIISITTDGVGQPVVTVISSSWTTIENLNTIDDNILNIALGAGEYLLISDVIYPKCPPILVVNDAPGVFTISTTATQVALLTDPIRYVDIETTLDGTTWVLQTTIPESDIAYSYAFITDPLVLGIRLSYSWQNGACTCPAVCPPGAPFALNIPLEYTCPVDCDVEREFFATLPAAGWRGKLQYSDGGAWVDEGTDEDAATWAAGITIQTGELFYRLVIYNQGCLVILGCPAFPAVSVVLTNACPNFTVNFTVPSTYPPDFTYGGVFYSLDGGTTWTEFVATPGQAIAVGPFVAGVDEVEVQIQDGGTSNCVIGVVNGAIFIC